MSEENTGFNSGHANIKIIICWLFLVSTALSQIPINGFCQLKSFTVNPGYKNLVIADINYDSFNDYILFSSGDNSLQLIERVKDSTIASYKIFVNFNISRIVPVFDKKTGTARFFFLDRDKRTAGLFYLTEKERLNFIDKIAFDSYPENISTGDINEDGNLDYLVSGAGFKGLSILQLIDGKLVETNIRSNRSYAEAVFADISNDGFPDIIAFNLFSNSLDIFFNDEFGNFELIRSMHLNENIENLKTVRFNEDFDNIVYSSIKSIKIIAGGFESAYDKISTIKTEYQPDRFVVSDFNNDRLKDIAYIDKLNGTLSILFAKNEKQFYPEIVYLKKEGITDLKVIRKNYYNSLVLLNSNGEIFMIKRLSSLPEETKIIPAIQPNTVISFDYGNDGIKDICYIDQSDNTLNFLINNYLGIPTYFYSTSVSTLHSEIIVDDTKPFNKEFYCYSTGNKMLEIIDYDFAKVRTESDQLYAPGTIEDLAIERRDDLVHIYVALEMGKVFKIGEYEYHYFRYNYREYSFNDFDIVKAKLFISDSPELYFWKNQKDSLYFIKAKTNSKITFYQKIGGVGKAIYNSSNEINEYMFGGNNPTFLTLFETDSSLYATISSDSIFAFLSQKIDSSASNSGVAGLITFYHLIPMSDESIITYIPGLKSFNKIDTKIRGGKLFAEKLFDKENVKDYVVGVKNHKESYIICTAKSEGYLTLKRIR